MSSSRVHRIYGAAEGEEEALTGGGDEGHW